MTSIIHKYLSEHYHFDEGRIRLKFTSSRYYFSNTLSKIIEELSLIFALTKKQLKYYIKGWVRKQNRGFHFERYWNPPRFKFEGIFSQMIRRVYSGTIAMDIQRTEPIVVNWVHHVNQPEPVANLERYATRLVNPQFYGLLNIPSNIIIEGNTQLNELNQIQEQERSRQRRQRIIEAWEEAYGR